MSTLSVAAIKSQSSSPPTIQNTSGTEVGTFCRAWVNFNGTGTVAIRASFNVSSITDNGTGDYTVNFTTAMADANYSVAASGSSSQGFVVGYGVVNGFGRAGSISASSFRMFLANNSNTSVDEGYVFIAIFR